MRLRPSTHLPAVATINRMCKERASLHTRVRERPRVLSSLAAPGHQAAPGEGPGHLGGSGLSAGAGEGEEQPQAGKMTSGSGALSSRRTTSHKLSL